jgi:hypothetical protein
MKPANHSAGTARHGIPGIHWQQRCISTYYARKDIRRSCRSSSNSLQIDLSTHGLTAKKAATASDITTTGGDVVAVINTLQQIITLLKMRETGYECFSFVRRAVCGLVVEKGLSSLNVHTLQPSECRLFS